MIVKEVGFGMSKETVEQLHSVGVSIIDVGGFGGTNFAKIENERRAKILGYFNEWGIPTAASIVEAVNVSPAAFSYRIRWNSMPFRNYQKPGLRSKRCRFSRPFPKTV